MAETLVAAARRGRAESGADQPSVRRPRALPGGRAIVGGLLVTLAAVGVFAAYRDANAAPSGSYVVAARRLAVGSVLRPGDLRAVAVDLPASLRRRVFTDPGAVVGARLLGPLDAGELVQVGNLVANASADGRQLSFSIEAARALNGAVRPGERVDVLATYGSGGGDAYTAPIAERVLVVDVASSGSSLNAGRSLVLTLALADPGEVLAVTHAARSGAITLVRSAGSRYGGAYRPAAPARTAPP